MCQERALVNAFHYVWYQPINLLEEESTGVRLQNYKNFLEYKNFLKEKFQKKYSLRLVYLYLPFHIPMRSMISLQIN